MSINSKALKYFQHFSQLDLWKLLLDKNHQTQGPDCFEDIEPSYLKSMFHALDYMFGTIGDPLTVDSILALHTHAIGNTFYRHKVQEEFGITEQLSPFTKGFRKKGGTEYGLVTSGAEKNCSEEGFVELLGKLEKGDTYFYIDVRNSDGNHVRRYDAKSTDIPASKAAKRQRYQSLHTDNNRHLSLSIPACPLETLTNRIQSILEQYRSDIANAKSDDGKIRAIANCIHELEVTHAFYDGNGRTNMLMLLTKLLIENDLSPARLMYADRFDGFSVSELSQEIKDGQHNFQQDEIPDTPPEGILLHLDGNATLMQLVAHQIAACMTLWYDAGNYTKKEMTTTQRDIITIIHEVLKYCPSKTFDNAQLESLRENITLCLDNAKTSSSPVIVDLRKFRGNLETLSLLPPKHSYVQSLMSILVWESNVLPGPIPGTTPTENIRSQTFSS